MRALHPHTASNGARVSTHSAPGRRPVAFWPNCAPLPAAGRLTGCCSQSNRPGGITRCADSVRASASVAPPPPGLCLCLTAGCCVQDHVREKPENALLKSLTLKEFTGLIFEKVHLQIARHPLYLSLADP